MSIVIAPSREDWQVLRRLGLTSNQAVVLVHPDIVDELKEEEGIHLEHEDYVGYDFGGEADVMLDVVCDMEHLFVTRLTGDYKDYRDKGYE